MDVAAPSTHASRGFTLFWLALLAGALFVGALAVVLILHARGVISIGILSSEPDPDGTAAAERKSVERAWRRGFERCRGLLDDPGSALGAATRAVDDTEATLRGMHDDGLLSDDDMADYARNLADLRTEIRLRPLVQARAWRPLHEALAPPIDQRSGRMHALPRRLDRLRQRARDELEKTGGPVVRELRFVRIPPGSYSTGTPPKQPGRHAKKLEEILPDRSVRQVRITDAYWIATTETPRSLYVRTLEGERPSAWKELYGRRNKRCVPASGVRYEDARRFCRALSKNSAAFTFTVPSEDEWEIACRAMQRPDVGPYVIDRTMQHLLAFTLSMDLGKWPEEARVLKRYLVGSMNYVWLLGQHDRATPPLPVRSVKPNRIGLYEMHGNLAEWCRSADKEGPVLRGGQVGSDYENLRAGARIRPEPGPPGDYHGFRIVARRR